MPSPCDVGDSHSCVRTQETCECMILTGIPIGLGRHPSGDGASMGAFRVSLSYLTMMPCSRELSTRWCPILFCERSFLIAQHVIEVTQPMGWRLS